MHIKKIKQKFVITLGEVIENDAYGSEFLNSNRPVEIW